MVFWWLTNTIVLIKTTALAHKLLPANALVIIRGGCDDLFGLGQVKRVITLTLLCSLLATLPLPSYSQR